MYLFSPSDADERQAATVHLPCVDECGFEFEEEGDDDCEGPSDEQIEAILRGLPGLKGVTLTNQELGSQVMRYIMAAGLQAFPALEWILFEQSDPYDSDLMAELLAIFPAVEFRVPAVTRADRDSSLFDVRSIKCPVKGRDRKYFSVRRLSTQPVAH